MTIEDILALAQAGFTPDQIAALAPMMTPAHASDVPMNKPTSVSEPNVVPAPEPAPAPEPVPAPAPVQALDNAMPDWAKSFISAVQQAAINSTVQQVAPKSVDEQAYDALANIISPYKKEGI